MSALEELSSPCGLTQLPAELLYLICQNLETEDLFSIAQLCRALNHVALAHYMSRKPLSKISEEILSLRGQEGKELIRCLQLATFVTSVRGLRCKFDVSWHKSTCDDVRIISGLISKLSHLQELTLDYTDVCLGVQYCLSPKCFSGVNPCPVAFDQVLEALHGKGCTHFNVRGGDVPLAARDICSLSAIMSRGMPEPAGSKGYHFKSLRSRFYSRCKTTARRIPSAGCRDQDFTDHWISPLLPWSQPGYIPPRPLSSLKCFELESLLLFHRPFLKWTIQSLNLSSDSITRLSFRLLTLPAEGWVVLLSLPTFPKLSWLTIASKTVNFADLSKFLIRHPSLTFLDLSHCQHNATKSRAGLLPPNTLPYLTTLCGCFEHISIFLSPEKSGRIRCPLLEHVSIQGFFPILVPRPLTPDFGPVNRALVTLAYRRTGDIHLRLTVVGGAQYEHWFDFKKSPTRSAESLLHCVTSLQLRTHGNQPLHRDTLTLIPRWLTLFPALKKVDVCSGRSVVTMSEKLEFVRLVDEAWKAERLSSETPPDVDYYSSLWVQFG
jgi:hypothetical protein